MFIKHVAELRAGSGAHVAAVHHGTKQTSGRSPLGLSFLIGADDALVEVAKQDDGTRTAIVVHAKDDPMRWAFRLKRVELETDGDGDPLTTLTEYTGCQASRAARLAR